MMDTLAYDISVFGEAIVQQCVLNNIWKRIWGAWKVLTGEAGIILVRVSPEKLIKN
jgi:hypothetical protein